MRNAIWLAGYPLLIAIALGAFIGAGMLGFQGLELYFGETGRTVESGRDFVKLSKNLESALLVWSFACLCLLIAFVAAFAVVKSLVDDLSRASRGPIDGDDFFELEATPKP